MYFDQLMDFLSIKYQVYNMVLKTFKILVVLNSVTLINMMYN